MLIWISGFRRNLWLCDEELQAILLSHLTPGIAGQVEKYQALQRQFVSSQKAKEKGKGNGKGTVSDTESAASEPLIHLLGVLVHFWKKKFTINAPGLRKNGYSSMTELGQILSVGGGLQGDEKGREAPTLRGERIESLRTYREMARKLEGSRDVGAQFFTALLRALGFKARMAFSLQPLGFSFHGSEEMKGSESLTEGAKESPSGERDTSGAGWKKKQDPEHPKRPSRKRKKVSTPESDAEKSGISEDEEPESQFEEGEGPAIGPKSAYSYI